MKLLELAELLKTRVVKLFPNEIAVVVLYGSTAQGKDDKFSDLDMFAILDNKEESSLPWEFIFQGHTIDFWKMDWQEAERMVSGKIMSSPWAVSASLFVNSRILYTRSESDKNRFELLVEKTKRFKEENLKQILKEFNSGYSHIEIIKLAKTNNDLLSAQWAIWQLINNRSVQILSLINNSFLTKNWGTNLHEVFSFKILPENYSKLVTTLCTENNFDEMII
ncbi:MAG: nucleotidyltransferase domain-containing protein [Candidatus Hodarchaeota archaeon]